VPILPLRRSYHRHSDTRLAHLPSRELETREWLPRDRATPAAGGAVALPVHPGAYQTELLDGDAYRQIQGRHFPFKQVEGPSVSCCARGVRRHAFMGIVRHVDVAGTVQCEAVWL